MPKVSYDTKARRPALQFSHRRFTQKPQDDDPVYCAMNAARPMPTLFDRIHSALVSSPYVPSRKVSVEATDGRVILKGNVESFFQKQMAQEAIRRVDGVELIDNLLEVNWA